MVLCFRECIGNFFYSGKYLPNIFIFFTYLYFVVRFRFLVRSVLLVNKIFLILIDVAFIRQFVIILKMHVFKYLKMITEITKRSQSKLLSGDC